MARCPGGTGCPLGLRVGVARTRTPSSVGMIPTTPRSTRSTWSGTLLGRGFGASGSWSTHLDMRPRHPTRTPPSRAPLSTAPCSPLRLGVIGIIPKLDGVVVCATPTLNPTGHLVQLGYRATDSLPSVPVDGKTIIWSGCNAHCTKEVKSELTRERAPAPASPSSVGKLCTTPRRTRSTWSGTLVERGFGASGSWSTHLDMRPRRLTRTPPSQTPLSTAPYVMNGP